MIILSSSDTYHFNMDYGGVESFFPVVYFSGCTLALLFYIYRATREESNGIRKFFFHFFSSAALSFFLRCFNEKRFGV